MCVYSWISKCFFARSPWLISGTTAESKTKTRREKSSFYFRKTVVQFNLIRGFFFVYIFCRMIKWKPFLSKVICKDSFYKDKYYIIILLFTSHQVSPSLRFEMLTVVSRELWVWLWDICWTDRLQHSSLKFSLGKKPIKKALTIRQGVHDLKNKSITIFHFKSNWFFCSKRKMKHVNVTSSNLVLGDLS